MDLDADPDPQHWLVPRFVVLHGTDTLAYTSSALSFMLENLGKTVILTGSQIPCFETRSGEFFTPYTVDRYRTQD
jgi:hypothetical protein